MKFVAPTGKHFMTNDRNKIMTGNADHPGSSTYIWTKVISVNGNGTENYADGLRLIIFNDIAPTGAILNEPKSNLQQT